MNMNYKRYIAAFIITSAVFATAIILSNWLNEKKLAQVQKIEDKMSIDILSLETQFDLLQELSCKQIGASSILTNELSGLAQKLSYMETERGSDDEEVLRLKRRYSLLQIKDLLLIRKISEKCQKVPTVILYFYSNKGNCESCKRQGYVLTEIGREYPNVRIYAFDANLDISALQTLLEINKVGNDLPIIVINGKKYTGFQSLDTMRQLLPQEETATTTATSTEEI